MAKISLRTYNHEIENLIDRGQTEEGISHCKYILKTYPKHLDTYRLLGKAFLESQRYSEAADILQRILSVQPDDFVSQIGMSIIREDEGNLDAAIYHMERAFEIQPANVAIQDELRRLYGRRDGVEPSKLRMTRGALVRMYARGDLYRQAIAEVRAALKEDPQRLDLEIVLARMYFQTGLKAEAAEISSRLVGKLPYCYEANKILAEVLPETSRAEEAKTYQQKLIALDPYLAYMSETVIDPRQVPENAVSLDRLDWTPSIEGSQQPTWANSLGIKLNESENEKMPDWMIAVPSSNLTVPTTTDQQDTAQPFTEEPALFESQIDSISPQDEELNLESAENDLPDWMKSSGWGISNQPAQEQPEATLESEDLAAEPANIPDWLKDIAPESVTAVDEEEVTQNADWINSILPSESIQKDLTDHEMANQPISEVLPDISEVKATSPVNEELPDWFKTTMTPVDESMFANHSNEPLPDWLTETPRMHTESTNIEELPGVASPVLSPVEQEEINLSRSAGDLITFEPESTSIQLEDQLQDIPQGEIQEIAPDLTNADEAMAWLESLAAKNGADEATLLTRPEERIDTPPEWVSQVADQQTSTELAEPEDNFASDEQLTSTALPDAISESLEKPSDPLSQELLPSEPMIAESIETPAIDFIEPEGMAVVEDIAEPVDQSAPSETVDMDAAFSWLESLAAKQGAEAESLLSTADERQEAPPEWIQVQAAEAAILGETASIADSEPTGEHLPEWLQSTDDSPAAVEELPTEEPAMPAWLSSTDSSSEQPFTHHGELPPVSDTLPVAEEWIHEQDIPGIEVISEPVEDKNQITEVSSVEVTADVEQTATFGNTRPLPSWLVNGANTPKNIEPEPGLPESIEDLPLPEWLKDESTTLPIQPSTSEISEAVDAPELPDWLKDLETEQDDEVLPVTNIPSSISETLNEAVVISQIPSEMLAQAQEALSHGQIDLSMSIYSQLIQRDEHIEETIHDLRDALYRYPVDSEIWQTLGDANFRNNHVQEALDAYTKAEELLK